jgi:hypothetical protein
MSATTHAAAINDLREIYADLTARTADAGLLDTVGNRLVSVAADFNIDREYLDRQGPPPVLRCAAGLLGSIRLLPDTIEYAGMHRRILEEAVTLIAGVLGGAR